MTRDTGESGTDTPTVLDDSREQSTGSGGWSRRGVLAGVGASATLALGAVGHVTGQAPGQSGDPWRLVALPDTQAYPSAAIGAGQVRMEPAHAQTEWIANNVDEENIAFVSHEGDVVWLGGHAAEYDRMEPVLSKLDGVVPYGVCVGNHDYHVTNLRSSTAETFTEYFGADRYAGYDWFGGAGPTGRNFYQTFAAGGYDFLNLSLEFEVPGEPDDPSTPVGWAQGVIDDHPERAVILTTHAYLSDGVEGRHTENEELEGAGNTGQQLWEKLVRPNDQVFAVLNGHFHERSSGPLGMGTTPDDGEYHQVSQNAAGSAVYEMLANYQDRANGGDGWLRILSFVPGGGEGGQDRIQGETYSPYLDEYQTGAASEFHFDLEFDERFADFGGEDGGSSGESGSSDTGGWGGWGGGGDGGSDGGGEDGGSDGGTGNGWWGSGGGSGGGDGGSSDGGGGWF